MNTLETISKILELNLNIEALNFIELKARKWLKVAK